MPIERTRILVAEDDEGARAALVRLLRGEGYDVVEASSGDELTAYLGLTSTAGEMFDAPDLIVSDVCMPGPSGLDVLEALSRTEWRIPVVLMTGARGAGMTERAERAGVVAFVDKPVSFDALLSAIANAMRM